ncbi:MAG: 4Fe-4S ferredoxin, partial [Rhodocyclales bacterium]|nr:4Fe-4S ferredoxin [Rhodocyclales bacterium]
RLDAAVAAQRLHLAMESTVQEIAPQQVTLKRGDESIVLANDAVIVCAGGELPTPMLKKIGIKVEAHYGT